MASPKKIALYSLIGSVILSALLGIIAILGGNFGWLEIRVLLTTTIVSVASLSALSSAALAEKRPLPVLPAAGLVLSILGGGMLIAGVWIDVNEELYWKVSASVSILAIATAHVCLLMLARLARRFVWVQGVAFVAIYGMAAILIGVIFYEPNDSDFILRVVGVDSILIAAVTIVIPVLFRLSVPETAADADEPDARVRLLCPRCAASVAGVLGENVCPSCGCRFAVTIL